MKYDDSGDGSIQINECRPSGWRARRRRGVWDPLRVEGGEGRETPMRGGWFMGASSMWIFRGTLALFGIGIY